MRFEEMIGIIEFRHILSDFNLKEFLACNWDFYAYDAYANYVEHGRGVQYVALTEADYVGSGYFIPVRYRAIGSEATERTCKVNKNLARLIHEYDPEREAIFVCPLSKGGIHIERIYPPKDHYPREVYETRCTAQEHNSESIKAKLEIGIMAQPSDTGRLIFNSCTWRQQGC